MADVPISCSLDSTALASRRAGLLGDLLRQASSRSELPDGLQLVFPPSSITLESIARAIDAERQCCRFLAFRLSVPPDGAAFVLDLTGPSGTREFLHDLLSER